MEDTALTRVCLTQAAVGKHEMGAFNDSRKEQSVPMNAALPSLPSWGKKFLVECSNIFELKFFACGHLLCAFCCPSAWLETGGSDLQKCQVLTAAAVVTGSCTLNTLNPMISLVLRNIRPQVCQIGSKINGCFWSSSSSFSTGGTITSPTYKDMQKKERKDI